MEGKVILEKIRGKLIVSCQALPSEPMYSAEYPIMKHFAKAAMLGGAGGIRANTVRDIAAIKGEVPLPVIGIIKPDNPGPPMYLTGTMKEVDELVACGGDILAVQGYTARIVSNRRRVSGAAQSPEACAACNWASCA